MEAEVAGGQCQGRCSWSYCKDKQRGVTKEGFDGGDVWICASALMCMYVNSGTMYVGVFPVCGMLH